MSPHETARKARTVLVAECPEICTFLRRLLEQAGYEVLSTLPECAEGALRANAGRIDVVITNKPERCFRFGVRIVYIAAIPDPASAARCDAAMRKPFPPRDLLAALEAVLKKGGAAGQPTAERVEVQSETGIRQMEKPAAG